MCNILIKNIFLLKTNKKYSFLTRNINLIIKYGAIVDISSSYFPILANKIII